MPATPTVHEYSALALPEQTKTQVKMCKLRLHSSGVFSNVYRGTLLEPAPQREIAVKKTWPESESGAHKNYEVLMLLELSKERHLNIVQVLYSFKTQPQDGRVCESMIFDFMPSTLHSHVKTLGGQHLNLVDIKIYTWQLFNGLHYLEKPQNILINAEQGMLKIGDFGSAKVMKPNVESTAYQVTRFYRPPELLLDAVLYTPLVDVWSGGCVFGEMLRGYVLFPGRDSKHQLKLVVEALGSPDSSEQTLMNAQSRMDAAPLAPRGFNHLLPNCPRDSIDFLQRILVYTPSERLHGSQLLSHIYFSELFTPNKKRSNGQYVHDIPSFKEMIDIPKTYRIPKLRRKIGGSRDAIASTQETSRLSADSLEYRQPSSGTTHYVNSKESVSSDKNMRSTVSAVKSSSMDPRRWVCSAGSHPTFENPILVASMTRRCLATSNRVKKVSSVRPKSDQLALFQVGQDSLLSK